MRFSLHGRHNCSGSVLLTTLWTMLIVGAALYAYLQITSNQNHLVHRTQVWNSCIPVAEAGIEEALTHLTHNPTNLVSNGWSSTSSNCVVRTNKLADGWFSVTVSTTNAPAVIISTGLQRLGGTAKYISRTVRVTAEVACPFNGLIVRQELDMAGGKARIDSFDSRDPLKSTLSKYDPLKAGDKANVACMSGSAGDLDVGSGELWGRAVLGPGGSVRTSGSGAVGSRLWHLAGGRGVQAGWSRTDNNLSLPHVVPPFTAAIPPASGTVGGVLYDYVFDGGNFAVSRLDKKAIVTAPSVIYVQDRISSQLLVIQSAATVEIYCAGSDASFSSVVNHPGVASALMYYGLPANTSLSVPDGWIGMVYAPSVNFAFGGNDSYSGSLAVNSVRMHGNVQFHYDEALGSSTGAAQVRVTSWTEL
jgi:hypothetical protein